MVSALMLLSAAAAQPSPEGLRLGRQLAEVGTLTTLLPLMKQSEIQELINDNPQLTPAEQLQLRAVAERVFEQGRDRLLTATARAYAEQLSIRDMRRVLAFQSSPAGKRYRSAMPTVIVGTIKSVGKMDFKGDVRAAFCKDAGKLCAK
jgi:hypothetical protein